MTTIMIDPGHGGKDSGAVYGSYREKDFTLNIGLRVQQYLKKHYQATIFMTRTTDTYVSLSQRTSMATAQHADYFCSIHVNAGGGTGWESYIYNGTVPSETVDAQTVIHQHVMGEIGPKYGIRDRGKKRANFYVLRETSMSAILLENLFIDHSSDLKLLTDSTFIQDLSIAIGDGIASALHIPKKFIYKVIAGSFKNQFNAVDRVNHLSSHGIEAFIWKVTIDGEVYYRVQAGAFHHQDNAEERLKELKAIGITDAFILPTE
ncbi:N-acetylmuramoyl-L-alanine amidase [Melghirimyces algeriensis]|uniref:N-acetylmuramoyl-L-alanine amidase n=1 Tax=Melghirimyces algeriensis TaxID=910412 RepID=A0A521CVI0_9BACL|nr:N-acetylmuramoyl-L-alanine amidase [Melghirimyces algeriensis]SMO63433.1 N-acetylmuramoyl-L-alanine amidase [Melghirimyces algeriensis]